jgi:AcrR family transcriptional regulator
VAHQTLDAPAGARRARRRKGGRRRSRATLTRQRILEKALELVATAPDGDLSMRALADALGVAPMSLYRHVRNKDDLLDGLTSHVFGRWVVELPASERWTDRTLAWMHDVREKLHEHPAVVPLLRTRTRYAPALLRAIDALLAILRGAGFADDVAVRASREIMWFTFGFVFMEIRTRQEYPDAEVGAFAIQAFPAPDSPEAARIPHLLELLPHFMKGEADETFAEGARHLVAGLAASLHTPAPGEEPTR